MRLSFKKHQNNFKPYYLILNSSKEYSIVLGLRQFRVHVISFATHLFD